MDIPNVLFITDKDFVTHADTGGKQGALKLYTLCINTFTKANVTLLIFSEEGDIEKELEKKEMKGKAFIIEHGYWGRYYNMLWLRDGYSKKQLDDVKKYVRALNPNIVFFDGTCCGSLAKIFKDDVKIIASYQNIEKHYAQERLFKSNPIWLIRFFAYWYNESYISKRANIHICLNERDNRLLYKTYHKKAEYFLPVTLDDIGEENVNMLSNEDGYLLFVGSYFMPNIRGIKWFCKNVMPQISKKLLIVGKGMEKLKKQLASSNVEVIGTVKQVAPYYNDASAVVMPIFEGDGMKVKTAQAMMYGKPIFATDEALEGYEVEYVKGIYRCNTKQEFISSLSKKYKSGYEADIRELFLRRYDTQAVAERFKEYFSSIGNTL